MVIGPRVGDSEGPSTVCVAGLQAEWDMGNRRCFSFNRGLLPLGGVSNDEDNAKNAYVP